MLRRLGTVLYWLGCIIAGLTAAFGVYVFIVEGYGRKDGPMVTGVILLIAFVIWLAGFALSLYPFRTKGVGRASRRSRQVLG
jgi:hypothetical protein